MNFKDVLNYMIESRDLEEFDEGEMVKLFIENIKREASVYDGDCADSGEEFMRDARKLDNDFISPLVDMVCDLITQYENLMQRVTDCEEE
ncbi:hypothetical protein ACOB3G_002342 [Vibrio cholerae]